VHGVLSHVFLVFLSRNEVGRMAPTHPTF
jgi:hypothetical protein